jgi:predicted amino acid-binding ACT domain protein
MKSLKQKEQQSGYNRDALIFRILEQHKIELQDMTNKQLVDAWKFTMTVQEEPSTRVTEILGDAYDETIREEGLIITPKVSPNDKRMASKWEKHQEYSKQTSRENLRTEPRHQSEK